MKFIKRIVCNPYVFVFLLFVAVFEGVLLFRHGFFKNALIERGFITQKKEERSDYHCLLAWENTLKKMNYKADICFIGNSLTYNADFQKDFPDKKVINLGYSGDRVEGLIARHRQIASVNPDKIFIMIGINDLSYNYMTAKKFSELYAKLLDNIQNTNPESQIYLQNILPINHDIKKGLTTPQKIVDANLAIKSIAIERGVTYIDLYSLFVDKEGNLKDDLTTDGIHLNKNGYSIWSNTIKKYIYE